jgi:hypothetical protein
MLQTIKSMGLYPCPRCLVLKADIPEVGSFLDMNHREKTARMYSIRNVEAARKAIFDSGGSISYKGIHDTLKMGSWAPTRVRSFPMLAPQLIDWVLAERICDRTQPQPVLVDGGRYPTRRGAWFWEGWSPARYPPSACVERGCHPNV